MLKGERYNLHMIDVGNRLANYIYVLYCRQTQSTIVFDPTEAQPVLDFLKEHQLTLDIICNTHHHHDHTDGNAELKKRTGCNIIGSAEDARRIPYIDTAVKDGEMIKLAAFDCQIMDISGHTQGHIAFHLPEEKLLFSGDTLFSAGCGRMFEGTPEQFYASLLRIAALPNDTIICGAHEYTVNNCEFALQFEPDNDMLKRHYSCSKALREQGKPTVPTTLELELNINPFLRTDNKDIRKALKMKTASDAEVFGALRKAKDNF